MKKYPIHQSLIILFALISTFTISAQKRQGNIVEYFGKEKVNDVKEGKIAHVFKDALYLTTKRSALNSISFPPDMIFKDFLMSDKTVSEGEIATIDDTGTSHSWTKIEVDETNTFNDPALRGAYLYLSYRSPAAKTVLFEASGHTQAIINGYPHEGDYYDFGYSLIPIQLKKGINVFVLKAGRFSRMRARLIQPKAPIILTTRDMTLPDLLAEESMDYKGAIRVINTSESWAKNFQIKVKHLGKESLSSISSIPPMSTRKVSFDIPPVNKNSEPSRSKLELKLLSNSGSELDSQDVDIQIKSKYGKHKRTFMSQIDNSVQYFSVAPSSTEELKDGALFLSVHGASVEAVNQANAYKQKDWGHVVAPTNRRPFGFAWEDWGRLDALEVLAEGKKIYRPDPQKIYLTGHSMGGHGTWYLGATYPDKFAAIAPCAGYPDLLGYRDSFVKRALKATEAERKRWGITSERLKQMQKKPQLTDMDHMILRAGNPSRTLKLKRNYLQQGVYILHGEKDNVVPTFIAREMREELGKFHPDFTYYEYPEGTHWYGDHSMDWPPIFELFKNRTIKSDSLINKMEFYTASPGVSAKSHFITIYQQQKPFEISSVDFSKENGPAVTTNNVLILGMDLESMKLKSDSITIDNVLLKVPSKNKAFYKKTTEGWQLTSKPSLKEKGPHRNGGFKDAFNNQMVFVYATKGNTMENKWYFNKARLDAETFYYRANGSVELVPDTDFDLKKYADRNVVLYGNKSNNSAWKKLLKDFPVQVENNLVTLDQKVIKGNQWGLYFIAPRPDSDTASVGVVSATGINGMKAIYSNHYLLNGTSYPDLLLFGDDIMEYGSDAVKCAGFFGNDWSIENGDFQWR
ncbi:alpha/beta fold hydrolase [Flagellimonas pacifica]|uniref:Prolyl oligopeptidase family protein n=1 Tax=Flagellimonas pacifica TaxID=1247520 RepID=A0A285MXB3_9FLAO|nr:alpha/beta fold hydrolase [Allomuricauda parva]SNZ01850.1 Prolyl oligopeptidase family protein [Allomuricauda parva]